MSVGFNPNSSLKAFKTANNNAGSKISTTSSQLATLKHATEPRKGDTFFGMPQAPATPNSSAQRDARTAPLTQAEKDARKAQAEKDAQALQAFNAKVQKETPFKQYYPPSER